MWQRIPTIKMNDSQMPNMEEAKKGQGAHVVGCYRHPIPKRLTYIAVQIMHIHKCMKGFNASLG